MKTLLQRLNSGAQDVLRATQPTLGKGLCALAGATLWASAAAAECPDPRSGASSVTLSAGALSASTRDFAARYVAGPIDSGDCPSAIHVGNFNRVPSLALSLTDAVGGTLRINLRTNDDQCDPVVLVQAPDGQWFNNDDSGSQIGRHWDALVDIPAARSGVYSIWLGHYRTGETCEGTLRLGYSGASGPGGQQPPTPGGAPPAAAGTVYTEWHSVTNDQRQFAAQPGGVDPMRTCDAASRSWGGDFPIGSYDIYVGSNGESGLGPVRDIRRFTVSLESQRRYAVDLGGPNGFSVSADGGSMILYQQPAPGFARIYIRNSSILSWRSICVLPSGWPRAWCEFGMPYPCNGPGDVQH